MSRAHASHAHAPHAGFPLPDRADRSAVPGRLWPRRLLVAILVATTLAVLATVAFLHGETEAETPPVPVTSRLVESRTMAELAGVPGFQRRGNTVVGEVCTREGQTLRLVIDARTQALVGFRQLSPAESGNPVNRSACLPAGPLPIAQSPAN